MTMFATPGHATQQPVRWNCCAFMSILNRCLLFARSLILKTSTWVVGSVSAIHFCCFFALRSSAGSFRASFRCSCSFLRCSTCCLTFLSMVEGSAMASSPKTLMRLDILTFGGGGCKIPILILSRISWVRSWRFKRRSFFRSLGVRCIIAASGTSFSVVILIGMGCSTYGVIFSTFTSVYALFCPKLSPVRKGRSHHSTSGMGSRRMILGSIFRTPSSALFASSSRSLSFLSSFFSSFLPFFSLSFSLSMPRAFSCIFLTSRASFRTSAPSSTKRKVFLLVRSNFIWVFRLGSKNEFSLDPSFFRPRIFFRRASFSRLMFTFSVLTTCGLIGTTLPSSSSSRPNSSKISFRAFGPSPGRNPAARPWVFSLAICSWICLWNMAALLAFSRASRAACAALERSMPP
mmetsp:Transcript_111362/g.315251  ORF Transcript_111362/g.315251 Transcript_111362/m.315251 type:complete len:404 (-) Transcript_111362:355-1566(-)